MLSVPFSLIHFFFRRPIFHSLVYRHISQCQVKMKIVSVDVECLMWLDVWKKISYFCGDNKILLFWYHRVNIIRFIWGKKKCFWLFYSDELTIKKISVLMLSNKLNKKINYVELCALNGVKSFQTIFFFLYNFLSTKVLLKFPVLKLLCSFLHWIEFFHPMVDVPNFFRVIMLKDFDI